MATYIVDIDGTVADTSHRQYALKALPGDKPDWELFFNLAAQDKPIPHMWTLFNDLYRVGVTFIYASGRPERLRKLTVDWLDRHDFPMPDNLYMRADGDRRDDAIVKAEILGQIYRDGYKPTMAFDDRDRVVKMWREHGIPCAQVAEGNF